MGFAVLADLVICKSLDLTHRSGSDFAIHLTASIIGVTASVLSRTRASLAPAKPVLRILDRIEPLGQDRAAGQTRRQEMNGRLRFPATVTEISSPVFYR